jgi:spore coat protein U-like protein
MRWLLSFLLLWPAYSQACYVVSGLNELQFGVYDPGSAITQKKKVTLKLECLRPGGVTVIFDSGKNSATVEARAMAGWSSNGQQKISYNLYKTEAGVVLGSGAAGLSFNVSGGGGGQPAKGQANFWGWIKPLQKVGTGYFEDSVQVVVHF